MADAPSFPRALVVDIRLDDDPRYKGSIHDDDVARARGYRAALVPGAFIYGHVSRLAIEAWGEDWAKRGAIGTRFRRPVYNGDRLTLEAGPLEKQGIFSGPKSQSATRMESTSRPAGSACLTRNRICPTFHRAQSCRDRCSPQFRWREAWSSERLCDGERDPHRRYLQTIPLGLRRASPDLCTMGCWCIPAA